MAWLLPERRYKLDININLLIVINSALVGVHVNLFIFDAAQIFWGGYIKGGSGYQFQPIGV